MRVIDDKQNIYEIDFPKRQLLKNKELITAGGDNLRLELGNFIGMLQGKKRRLSVRKRPKKTSACATGLRKIPAQKEICKKIRTALASPEFRPYISR